MKKIKIALGEPHIGEAGKTGLWRLKTPYIQKDKCLAFKKNKQICQICELYCPDGIIKKGIPPKINLDYCKGCGVCAEQCPGKAIIMK
jgi:pyruvate ferredoxin oxidoreductase delta subunit